MKKKEILAPCGMKKRMPMMLARVVAKVVAVLDNTKVADPELEEEEEEEEEEEKEKEEEEEGQKEERSCCHCLVIIIAATHQTVRLCHMQTFMHTTDACTAEQE